MKGLIATASITIDAPAAKVWDALTDPARIKNYMFGSEVASDWQVGSAITWSGEWQGKPYQDKGEILRKEENRVIEYSHYSPMMGKPDAPENYHTVRIELEDKDGRTTATLTQDNNADETARAHSEKNWKMFMEGLKKEAEA